MLRVTPAIVAAAESLEALSLPEDVREAVQQCLADGEEGPSRPKAVPFCTIRNLHKGVCTQRKTGTGCCWMNRRPAGLLFVIPLRNSLTVAFRTPCTAAGSRPMPLHELLAGSEISDAPLPVPPRVSHPCTFNAA